VVTDVKKASNALSWAVAEMERRYEVLEKHGARSIDGYNERSEQQMSYVVVVIDELADLMMAAASKVEDAVIRLAQKARAVGIHLVVATQRPSVDVITGMIKANIPSRIAFAVSSQVDSRVILDTPGAEALLGSGDMLFKPVTSLRSSRVQGAYITENEVEDIVSASTESAQARYIEEVTEGTQDHRGSNEEPEDDLLPDAASFVVTNQQASVSAVQRRFRVGYSRAGRIVDALERKGVVGPYEGSKARSIAATEMDLGKIFSSSEEEPEKGGGDEADPAPVPRALTPDPDWALWTLRVVASPRSRRPRAPKTTQTNGRAEVAAGTGALDPPRLALTLIWMVIGADRAGRGTGRSAPFWRLHARRGASL
jgi:S-DNA-T family DNA segregation ATPase FtsK/SpoIIIE